MYACGLGDPRVTVIRRKPFGERVYAAAVIIKRQTMVEMAT